MAILFVAGAILGLVQTRKGYPFRRVIPIAIKDIRSTGGDAYAVSGPLRRYLEKEPHPAVHMLEGTEPMRLRVASSQAVRDSATGAFALSSRQMWFRTTDGSDPRRNGRAYAAVFPLAHASWLEPLCWTALVLTLLLRFAFKYASHAHIRILKYGTLGAVIERGIVAAICVALFVPGLLALMIKSDLNLPLEMPWLRNATLHGVLAKSEPVALSGPTLSTGEWQKGVASQWDVSFPGREAFIRLTSEAWYRCFRQVALRSTGIIIGKEDNLFEKRYLDEYYLTRTTPENLTPFVRDIRRLQDVCESRGVAFVFVLTPSKASVQKATLPSAWIPRLDDRPRAYDQLVPLLAEHGVRFVDGHALTVDCMDSSPSPVFPRGGIHWNAHASLQTTNAMLATLRLQGLPLRPVVPLKVEVLDIPFDEERDLMDLMNLAIPWRYPVLRMTTGSEPKSQSTYLNASIVGGSFVRKIASQLHSSGQFREINYWFYYRLHKTCFGKNGIAPAAGPVQHIDFNREIFAANCLILEANEQTLGTDGPNHLRTFLREALAHAESGSLKDEPYLQETALPCAWGQKISFDSEGEVFGGHPLCQSGLRPASGGTAILLHGSASLDLSLPHGETDVILEVSLEIMSPKSDMKSAQLDITLNGQALDSLKIARTGPYVYRVGVKRELLREHPVCNLKLLLDESISPDVELRLRELCVAQEND